MLLVTLLGCSTVPVPRGLRPVSVVRPAAADATSALDELLRNDLSGDHSFPWSAARPLTWNDFQAAPPTEGREGAKTSYSLYSVWKCRGAVFEFRVIAGFRTRRSWVKLVVLNDSVQRRTVLGHEQTHFDLGELYARRMRQAFAALSAPCRKSDAALSALVQRIADEEKAEQRRYDAETHHGLLAAPQVAWSLQTRRRLTASR
jgi:hypothetical protein